MAIIRSGFLNYSLSDPGLRGQVKLIDEIVIHVQARNDDVIEETFQQAGLIVPNPKANILTEIAHTNKYFWHIAIFVLVYARSSCPSGIGSRVGQPPSGQSPG